MVPDRPALAVVETLYESNARSVPDMLRTAAASIETEVEEGFSPTTAMVAVQIAESGAIRVYGWGDTDNMHSIALLQRGLHSLLYDLAVRTEEVE